jgi:hypothetical protein
VSLHIPTHQVTDHNNKKATHATANTVYVAAEAKATTDGAAHSAQCTASESRQTAAADAQKAKDTTFFNEALAFVSVLEDKLVAFHGRGAAAAAVFLTLGETMRLRQLTNDFTTTHGATLRYLDTTARLTELRADAVAEIRTALTAVTTSIEGEMGSVADLHTANIKKLENEGKACLESTAFTAIVELYVEDEKEERRRRGGEEEEKKRRGGEKRREAERGTCELLCLCNSLLCLVLFS